MEKPSRLLMFFVIGFFLFLYAPIVVLILFSFNASPMPYTFNGFTTEWYVQLYHSQEAWIALKNSLIVAISTVVLSCVMAWSLVYYGNVHIHRSYPLFYGPLCIPEVVVAVGLLGFFAACSIPLSLLTLIAGHTLLGLGYAVPIIAARYDELDKHLTEASLDLGATRTQTMRRIIFPLLFPAFVSAALLIFVVSLDDFVIAFFCAGPQTQTLPLYIYSVVRTGGSPIVNALSSLLIIGGGMLILIFACRQERHWITTSVTRNQP